MSPDQQAAELKKASWETESRAADLSLALLGPCRGLLESFSSTDLRSPLLL